MSASSPKSAPSTAVEDEKQQPEVVVLSDGAVRALVPLTPTQIEAFEELLEQLWPSAH